MHTLNGDPNVAKLQEYTIKLYKEIEEASGQSCSIHITAGVDLAGTPERMDFLKVACARARYLGLDMEMLTIDEAAKLFPLLDKKHFVGALYNPLEGHVDPAGVTQAYAKAARDRGAEVYRFTRVTALEPRPDGTWNVITDKGSLVAEHVVNAGGLWAREVGVEECGRHRLRFARYVRIALELPGHGRAIVDHGKLPPEPLGMRRVRIARERNEKLAHPGTRALDRRLNETAVLRLRTGAYEGAAAKRRLGNDLAQ